MPGIAQGRAPSSLRAYGWNAPPLGSAKCGSIDSIADTSGSRHGSEEFCRNESESKMTGVRYRIATRAASSATSKHSEGEDAATIGIGDSPCRPNIAARRSPCSVLVGIPVDGPARWTSTTIIGSSVITARPIVSVFRSRPGPLVPVAASSPVNAAPSAMFAAAISSSACTVMTPKCLCRDSSWSRSDAGVIG